MKLRLILDSPDVTGYLMKNPPWPAGAPKLYVLGSNSRPTKKSGVFKGFMGIKVVYNDNI